MSALRSIAAWVFVGAALLAGAGCDESPTDELLLARVVKHANGLVIPPPTGFEVAVQSDGFQFRERGDIRSPRLVEVTLDESSPAIAADGHRRLPGGVRAAYAKQALNGGSGGTAYALIAWRAIDDRWIVVRGQAQSEWGEPGFPVVWALLERARIQPAE